MDLVNLERFRDSVKKGQPGTLLRALYETRSSLATDARDKVYALLGLTSDGNDIIRLPNYKQPVETSLTQMTKTFILRGNCLDLIALRRSDGLDRIGLPSWVPDCTELDGIIRPWQVQHLKSIANQLGLSYLMPERGGKDIDYGYECFGFWGSTLWVTRQIIGTIEDLSTNFSEDALYSSEEQILETQALVDTAALDRVELRPVVMRRDDAVDADELRREHLDLLHWIGTNQAFFANDRPLRAYFEPQTTPPRNRGVFETWYDVETRAAWQREYQLLQDLLNTIFHLIKQVLKLGIRFFLAGNGYFGIAHPQVQKEDSICLIRGCSMPMILRSCEGSWRVVGEAYLSEFPEFDISHPDREVQKFSLK